MRSLLSVRGVLRVLASMICFCAALIAQDSESPNSLGDLARQTRAQHASAPEDKSSKAQSLVDEMQQEQEAAENAPTGFKNYNAGDYRLFVPFPFILEGRENGGAVLVGSRLGITNTEVLAGTPVPMPPNLSDNDLASLVRQLARQHSQNSNCSASKAGSRKVFRCGMYQGYLLGRQVWGTMEYVVGSSSLVPVMCVSPDEHQCLSSDAYGYHACNNPHPAWLEVQETRAAIQMRNRDELTTAQMCDQIIYPSIQLKEDIVVHPVSISERHAALSAGMTLAQGNVADESESPGPSLAELARQTRQTPHAKAQTTLDNTEGKSMAPAGFRSFALQYCQNQQCSEWSVVIPEKAEMVSSINGQYIFKTALDGEPVMLYAGPADVNAPYRSMTDPDYIRMRDLANSNGWSREKPDAVSTQDLTIAGRPALMTRFRYQRDQKRWWIGERVLIENQGAQFLLGCAAPEEHFADAEVLCTTLVNSVRLP